MAELALAVVGTVDVALRSCLEIYRFFNDLKDSPAEIEELQFCIDENRQLLLATQEYVQKLNNRLRSCPTPAIVTSGQTALKAVESAVKALRRALDLLSTLARAYPPSQRVWSRIKWKLDARQVAKYRERLEASKLSLTNALVLVSRLDSACAIESFEVSLKTDLGRFESDTRTALTKHSKAMRTQIQATTTIKANITNASHVSQQEHRKTRNQLSHGHSRILERLERIDPNRSGQLRPAVKSGREIVFMGESPEDSLTSLLLLREHLRSAILKAVSRDRRASPAPLYQLISEVERLQASAMQEAAASIPGSSATSFDDWVYTGRAVGVTGALMPKSALQWSHSRSRAVVACQRTICRPSGALKTLYFRTPVGDLKVYYTPPDRDQAAACDSEETGFLFVPSLAISSPAVGARFLKVPGEGLEPRLYTQLNAFCVVLAVEDRYFNLMFDGRVEDIDKALRKGVISPYHVDARGRPWLLSYATYLSRSDILQYFDEQGVGISSLHNEEFASQAFWRSVVMSYGMRDLEKISRMQNYMRSKLDDFPGPSSSSRSESNLAWAPVPYIDEAEHDALRARIFYLQAAGYNFEQRLLVGITPLISCAEKSSHPRLGKEHLAAMRILLKLGVNVNATDDDNESALHYTLYSFQSALEERSEDISMLESTVNLLISAGVDLHHRSDMDETPSQLACRIGLWEEWCRALKRSGVRIEHMMEAEVDLPWESGWEDSDSDNSEGFDKGHSSDGSRGSYESYGDDESIWSDDNELYYNGSDSRALEDCTPSLSCARARRSFSLPASFRLRDLEWPSAVLNMHSTTPETRELP